MTTAPAPIRPRLPDWLKVPMPGGPRYIELKQLMRDSRLHTVCEEARCPNIGECWERSAATFMILGDICTRACAYCAVTSGRPGALDLGEPFRLAATVKRMGLQYCVITSVNRDDLPDGGAGVFAACIKQVRAAVPGCRVEALIPDFDGNDDALATVAAAQPQVLNHNIESVERVFRRVRPRGITAGRWNCCAASRNWIRLCPPSRASSWAWAKARTKCGRRWPTCAPWTATC